MYIIMLKNIYIYIYFKIYNKLIFEYIVVKVHEFVYTL